MSSSGKENVKVIIDISDADYEALSKEASIKGISIKELINQILEKEISRE